MLRIGSDPAKDFIAMTRKEGPIATCIDSGPNLFLVQVK